MIIHEEKVYVPCKKYVVKVTSFATRRLAAIEWLFLTCVKQFSSNKSMKNAKISSTFEKVFNIRNNEFILAPSISKLLTLNMILIDHQYNYGELTFGEISLTSEGEEMLEKGLILGDRQEHSFDVFYDPITGKTSTMMPIGFRESSIKFDLMISESDIPSEFPLEQIKGKLQSGDFLGRKFTASKQLIRDIEPLTSTDWTDQFELKIGINQSGELYTEPAFDNKAYLPYAAKLLATKNVPALPVRANFNDVTVQSSYNNIMDSLTDVVKSGKLIYLSSIAYNILKSKFRTNYFKGKTFIIGGTSEFKIENDGYTAIYFPALYDSLSLYALNDKLDNINVSNANVVCYDETITLPLIYSVQPSVLRAKQSVIHWMQDLVLSHATDLHYLSLSYMSYMSEISKSANDILRERWENSSASQIDQDMTIISSTLEPITDTLFSFTPFMALVLNEYHIEDNNFKFLETLFKSSLLSETERNDLSIAALSIYTSFDTNADLYRFRNIINLKSIFKEDLLPQLLSEYTENFYKDTLSRILDGTYESVPECTSIDSFLNEYADTLKAIRELLGIQNLFENITDQALRDAVDASMHTELLKYYVETLKPASSDDSTFKKMIIGIMNDLAPQKMSAFSNNLLFIQTYVDGKLTLLLNNVKIAAPQITHKARNIVIFDTCALINDPTLLSQTPDSYIIRIPLQVISELDKIKENRDYKYVYADSNAARLVSRTIEKCLKESKNEKTLHISIEEADSLLLPPELPASVPDHLILAVALKYKDDHTIIVSDDRNVVLKAKGLNFESFSSAEFLSEP